jgi:galactokinase
LVPFGGGGADVPVVIVTNSNVKHTLSGSEYPDRVAQCKKAVEVLKQSYPEVQALRDANMDQLNSIKDKLSDVVYNRAKHCIGEDQRTLTAVQSLSKGDFETVGVMMTKSHESLRDDYEVSCEELDILVKLALEHPGVYGSRMTGGGFGGCTVTLVKSSAVAGLKVHLAEGYFKVTGKKCEIYESVPSSGAGVLQSASASSPKAAESSAKVAATSSHSQATASSADASQDTNQGNIYSWILPLAVIGLAITVGMIIAKK